MPSCASSARPTSRRPLGARARRPGATPAMGGCRGGEADRLAVGVGQREHHAGQRDAVGDGVVHPHQQCAAAAEALQQVDVPQRLGPVERRGHEIGDDLLERAAVARSGHADTVEVHLRVEVRVVLPAGSATRPPLARALAEAREVLDDTRAEDGLRRRPVQRLVEPQHRVDDHEVGGAVHVQPGRIGGRHPVTFGHEPTLWRHGRRAIR